MPFDSGGQTYHGGQYLFSGLSGFGSSIGKGISDAIEKSQEQSKMESYNDSIMQHAYQSGQVDLEGLTKYRQMGHTQKTGFAASLAANFAEDMKREQLAAAREARQAQAEQRSAMAELRTQQAAAFNWTPDEAAKQSARWASNELVQTGPGKFQPVPYAGGGQEEVQTDPLKINGNVIPGIGVNRKTGQYVYYGGMQGGGVQVEIEPRTKIPFYRDPTGFPHPLSGQQIIGGQMLPPEAATTPTPTPAPDVRDPNVIFGGAPVGATPQIIGGQMLPPAAATTPTPTPAPDVRDPYVGGAPVGATPQPQPAKGSDVTNKRQQAIAILNNAGKPVTEANINAVIKKLGGGGG